MLTDKAKKFVDSLFDDEAKSIAPWKKYVAIVFTFITLGYGVFIIAMSSLGSIDAIGLIAHKVECKTEPYGYILGTLIALGSILYLYLFFTLKTSENESAPNA